MCKFCGVQRKPSWRYACYRRLPMPNHQQSSILNWKSYTWFSWPFCLFDWMARPIRWKEISWSAIWPWKSICGQPRIVRFSQAAIISMLENSRLVVWSLRVSLPTFRSIPACRCANWSTDYYMKCVDVCWQLFLPGVYNEPIFWCSESYLCKEESFVQFGWVLWQTYPQIRDNESEGSLYVLSLHG